MKENKFLVIFDVETSGLSLQDRIVQLSAIKVDKTSKKIISEFNHYIIPTGSWHISDGASKVNGLTDEFIKQHGVPLQSVLQEFIDLIEGSDMCGYNSNKFDVIRLYNELHSIGYEIDMNRVWYDVYGMETHLRPNNLGSVFERYTGSSMEEAGLEAHDSLSDVKATWIVMQHQLKNNNLDFKDVEGWIENQMDSPEGSIRNASNPGHQIKYVFANGKYKDVDVYDVLKSDPSYMKWWAEKVATPYTKEKVRSYCKQLKSQESQSC